MPNTLLRGFWKLTWLEMKIFAREPMGFIGTILVPALLFVILGRTLGARAPLAPSAMSSGAMLASPERPPMNVAILAAVVIAIGAVQSLVAIIAIYREGGILKRLRATPLSPITILGAHVVVKLIFTVASLVVLIAAGRRVFPGVMQVNLFSFTAALLLGTLSILSLGFVIASVVPTARFAQPIGAVVLYPMLALSGLFYPVTKLPAALQAIAAALPTTHAVALLQGVWDGSGWQAHWANAVMLVVLFLAFSALATRVFRWE
jgi:ABC-2 type transport system permease protein